MTKRVDDFDSLIAGIEARQRRALGRAATVLEDRLEGHRRLVRAIYPRTGGARVVGVTGPPGVGKSTLVERLVRSLRSDGQSVAVLAVDPSSPFTGGAFLGDRVRMQGFSADPDVFIRSMATRGAVGGVARATRDIIDLLDGAGFDWVLVETVGVGQDETDIVRTVDLVLLVTVPGLGDEIQAIKAGVMEIADIFVVNKADRDGAERTVRDLKTAISLVEGEVPSTPVLQTVAIKNEGIEELLGHAARLHDELAESGGLGKRRFQHLRLRVESLLKERILDLTRQTLDVEAHLRSAFEEREDPYSVSDRLLAEVVGVDIHKGGDL